MILEAKDIVEFVTFGSHGMTTIVSQGRKFILESNHRTLDSETEIS